MKLTKKNIHAWPYDLHNATTYLRYVLEFHSNLEFLLKCEEFNWDLNLHDWIFKFGNSPTLEQKKARFYRLEMTKWTIKDTLVSAIFYILKRKSLTGLEFSIGIIIQNYMRFICNDEYSDIVLEVYALFDVFNLYPEQCSKGCMEYFDNIYSRYYEVEKEAHLNSQGLIKCLNLIQIKPEPLFEIISLCNYLRSSVPFISFLKRYRKSNYDNFVNQSLYDQLATTVHSCSYSELEIFFENKNTTIDCFFLEFNKVEKERIFNLMFKKIQNKDNSVFSLCKGVGISCFLVLIGIGLIPIPMVSKSRYNSYSTNRPTSGVFAMLPTPGRNIYSRSQTNSASSTPSHQISNRSSFSSFAALNEDASPSQRLPFEEEKKILSKIIFTQKKKSILKRFAQWTCLKNPTTTNANLLENRPSTASTDIPSAQAFFPTSKRIIAGERLKKKQINLINEDQKATLVDSLFINGSEEKVGTEVLGIHQHIIRKEFKKNAIKRLNLEKTYAYFLPDTTGSYKRITLIGNVMDCAASKQLKGKFKKIVERDSAYQFIDNTFEHLIPSKWLETMKINRLPRSGSGDPSIGPLMSFSANNIMGKTQVSFLEPFLERQKVDPRFTIFSCDSRYTMVELLSKWCVNQQEAGLAQIQNKCYTEFLDAKEKIYQDCASKAKSLGDWNKLSDDKKYRKAGPQIEQFLTQKIDSGYSEVFDEALIEVYRQSYKLALPFSLWDINNWCSFLGLEAEQTPGYFVVRSVVDHSKSQIENKFCLIPYRNLTTRLVPCPLETCINQFKQQQFKTRLVEEMCVHLENSWPEISSNSANAKLAELLKKEQNRMHEINQVLLHNSREIYNDLEKKEASTNPSLVFFNKDGEAISQELSAGFSTYKKDFKIQLDQFEARIKTNNWETEAGSPLNSPQITFQKLWNNDEINLSVDVQTSLPSSFKCTKFIESFDCHFENPPESYSLESLVPGSNVNLSGSGEPSADNYVQ